ncbi:DUF4190 domain-containing protein [Glycomyces salinus]|uniref:DUF4190 domain-containing protein n=1 Tax=Glycomyces salinus TaxID=980294 RepID=UPI0018EDA431|nr:DUF4190 domain-containing protein [Glycomyces salinus]
MGTTALVLGICGLASGWIPVLGCLGWVACVLAIVFGAIGLAKANGGQATNKGSATAGLILGIAGLVVGVLLTVTLWSVADTSGPTTSTVEEDAVASETEGVDQQESTSDEDTAEEEEAEPAGIGDGIWEIGTEIAPGTYVATAPGDSVFDSCYVARLSGFSGEFEDIIANDNIDGGARGRVTISEDDEGIELSGGCEWQAASEANAVELGDSAGDGTWEVGTEIQPGTYVTQPEGEGVFDSCYVARLSGFGMDFEDIIANDNIDGGAQGRITIEDSDAGVKFSGGCTWEKE